jgi:hypothetical protein
MSETARDVRGVVAPTLHPVASQEDTGTTSRLSHTRTFSVIRGGVSRHAHWPPPQNTRDSLRRLFDAEMQAAIIAACSDMPRLPGPEFYEITRDPIRNWRPWGSIFQVSDKLIIAGASIGRVEVLADLAREYIRARGNERPETAAEAAIADWDRRSA